MVVAMLFWVSLSASGASPTTEPLRLEVTQHLNVTPLEAETFGAVCADKVDEITGRDATALVGGLAAGSTPAPTADAGPAGPSEVLELRLIRIGEGTGERIRAIGVRRGPGGSVKDARIDMAGFSDAPSACDRLVRSLFSEATVMQAAGRDNITQAEAIQTRAPIRLGYEKVPYVSVAFGSPVEVGYQPMGYLRAGFGFERDRFRIRAGAGFYFPAVEGPPVGYGGLSLEMGVDYLLAEGSSSFYVGAGVEPRINFGGAVLEVTPYACAGALLFRDSTNRVFVEARLGQNLLPVTSSASVMSTPTEATISFGMAFGP